MTHLPCNNCMSFSWDCSKGLCSITCRVSVELAVKHLERGKLSWILQTDLARDDDDESTAAMAFNIRRCLSEELNKFAIVFSL